MNRHNPLAARKIADLPAPLDLHREAVRPDWIDYNGHMNVAYYVLAFDHGTDVLFDLLAMDEAYRARTNCSAFVVESHITYQRELREGDPIAVTTQLLGYDTKRLHFHHVMTHGEAGFVAATNELLVLHVNYDGPRAAAFIDPVASRIAELWRSHQPLARPEAAGRAIRLP
ncbi:MAG: thioesterase family protein [Alphaproteobacteria bacterium]|nr:thioesterase family protein [Alphaproteobacteria bacterium]